MSEPLCGIVVAHGEVGASLIAAVESITGVTGALTSLSNDGLGAAELRSRLEARCGRGPRLVFVDLAAGSCAMAGLGLRATNADIGVVTGVNLPMLIDFVFHREMEVDALVARLEEKARAGIAGHPCGGTDGASDAPGGA